MNRPVRLSRNTIKYTAVIAMTCNHIANALLTEGTAIYELLTDIGYFTALAMTFLLAEGYLRPEEVQGKAVCLRPALPDPLLSGLWIPAGQHYVHPADLPVYQPDPGYYAPVCKTFANTHGTYSPISLLRLGLYPGTVYDIPFDGP